MGKSKIEWCTDVWNPVVGCSIVSPGCTNCYAMKQAARLLDGNSKSPHYAGTTKAVNGNAVWTGRVAMAPDHILTAPMRWTKPRRIFVNSMGDIFHEDVPDEWIDRVFAVMALSPQHTFQVLTKRSRRMREYMLEQWQGTSEFEIAGLKIPAGKPTGRLHQVEMECEPLLQEFGLADTNNDDLWTEDESCKAMQWKWPLLNVWLGVSAEDQARADERIPDLLATPAAIRFVSAEPLLGPIDFEHIAHENGYAPHYYATLSGYVIDGSQSQTSKLDWVIVGGESGPGARPMHPDWARSIRDQCAAADVPFFMKQMTKKGQIPDDLMVREFPALLPTPDCTGEAR